MPADEEKIVSLCQFVVKKEVAAFHRLPLDDSFSIAQLACLFALRTYKKANGPFVSYLEGCIWRFLNDEVKREYQARRCEQFKQSLDRPVRDDEHASAFGTFFHAPFDRDEKVSMRNFMADLTKEQLSIVRRLLMDVSWPEIQKELGLSDSEIARLKDSIAEKCRDHLVA
jgi:DNA-directed RNA polymerase specialized sigma subunit